MSLRKSVWGGPLPLCAAIVVLSFAFRAPALINAGTVDSDAAIVGLQARHILLGEWSWFLYGSGYQTSVDSCVAALFFALLGASSLALLLSTLVGHIVATGLAFATLARRLPPVAAFVLVLPLVFTSSPLHTYILNPPRQASLTLVFLALFVIDGASDAEAERWRLFRTALGTTIASLACFADPYPLLVLPALVLLSLATAIDGPPPSAATLGRRGATSIFGAAMGIIPLVLLLSSPRSVHGETTLTLGVLRHNAQLLLDPCLPWLLGAEVFVPKVLLGYVPWEGGGGVFRLFAWLGAALFVVGLATGGALAVRSTIPWPLRRLGAFGVIVAGLTVASFLVSVMVMDLFSSRYLAALVLMSPFALAPVAEWLGTRRLAPLLVPWVVASGVCGWMGYGAHVPGDGAEDERELIAELEAQGVKVAVADYWVSYRLTFLSHEAVTVVPIHAKEDRYPAYRQAYEAATHTAYIFDPRRSREELRAMEQEAFEGPSPWGTPGARLSVGNLTAVVFDKAASPAVVP